MSRCTVRPSSPRQEMRTAQGRLRLPDSRTMLPVPFARFICDPFRARCRKRADRTLRVIKTAAKRRRFSTNCGLSYYNRYAVPVVKTKTSPGVVPREGAAAPSLVVLRDGDFQGEGEIRNPLPLEWCFWALLPPRAKVPRARRRETCPLTISNTCATMISTRLRPWARVLHNIAGRRSVKKTCRWHVFSSDLGGYAAVASILSLKVLR